MRTASCIGALAFAVCAAIYLVVTVQSEREAIRAMCQPRGYVGGYMNRFEGQGCIAADGTRINLRDLK